MTNQPIYESGLLSRVTGGPLRPGGLYLTERMLALCVLSAGAWILDVGSGTGVTVARLADAGFRAVGIDRSELLLQSGKIINPALSLVCSWGNMLPVAGGQMDAVFSECSLSAMSGIETVLAECWRVLRPGGRLAVSDFFARSPDGLPILSSLPLSCGLRNILAQPTMQELIQAHGFEMITWEDHSDRLKCLAAQMILSHGSLCDFWVHVEPAASPLDIQAALRQVKLGYYLLVAEKNENSPR